MPSSGEVIDSVDVMEKFITARIANNINAAAIILLNLLLPIANAIT
jgi:hypothetical protein